MDEIDNINTEKLMSDIAEYIEGGSSYMDAVVEYAEANGIEIELVGEVIKKSPILKSKIHREASEMRLVEKEPTLDI